MDESYLYDGAVWESFLTAASKGVSNLFLVVEMNDNDEDESSSESGGARIIGERFVSFGWSFVEADGNDFESLERAFQSPVFSGDGPRAVVAGTRGGMPHNASLAPGMSEKQLTRDDVEIVLSQLESKSSRRSGLE
jgi:transketolase